MLSVIGWGIGLYASLVALGWLGQSSLLYPAPSGSRAPAASGARLLEIPGSGGRLVYALHLPARGEAPTLVHFHGNGEDLSDQAALMHTLSARGLGVLAVEYPGYGLARAYAPSEANIYADAETALARLRDLGVGPERTVLSGLSLGTGVAAEMAHRGHGSRLVLIAPYTSMVEMAGRVAPFLPVRWIVRDRFDTKSKAPELALPALVIHGSDDELIPIAMGRRIAELLPRARLVLIERGGHNDLLSVHADRVIDAIADFSLHP
jgi:uncharacterized protein